MEIAFKMLAAILIGIAAYFLWTGSGDNAFIAAAAGAVCFFLSVRFQVKDRIKQRESEEKENFALLEHSADSFEKAEMFAVSGQPSAGNNRSVTADGERLPADAEQK